MSSVPTWLLRSSRMLSTDEPSDVLLLQTPGLHSAEAFDQSIGDLWRLTLSTGRQRLECFAAHAWFSTTTIGYGSEQFAQTDAPTGGMSSSSSDVRHSPPCETSLGRHARLDLEAKPLSPSADCPGED